MPFPHELFRVSSFKAKFHEDSTYKGMLDGRFRRVHQIVHLPDGEFGARQYSEPNPQTSEMF